MQEAIDVQNAADTPGFLKRKAGGHARMQALVGSATLWTTPSTYLGLMAVPAIEKPMTAVAGAEAFVALARTALQSIDRGNCRAVRRGQIFGQGRDAAGKRI